MHAFEEILGMTVTVCVDRPIASVHPRFESVIYPINYGYVEGVIARDGLFQDVYVLGVDEPVQTIEVVIIAVIHRLDDVEDKWIGAPKGRFFSVEDIRRLTHFQERYFSIEIDT